LEARLGPYQERRPLLQEVDRSIRSEARERELAVELAPLRSAYQEKVLAVAARDMAAQQVETAGKAALPVGSEGQRSYQIAVEEMPRLGAAYTQARVGLLGAEHRLKAARQGANQLERKFHPQLEEFRQLEPRAERLDQAEQVLSLRSRDQIALARAHGPEVVDRAVRQAPEQAAWATAARERWMRNLAPSLDRALDRQLTRRGIPAPVPGLLSVGLVGE
jgi:hypothetical protein